MGSGYLHPYGAPRHLDTYEDMGRDPNYRAPSPQNKQRMARAWKRAERRRARENAWEGWEGEDERETWEMLERDARYDTAEFLWHFEMETKLALDSLGQNDEAHTKEK